MNKTHWNCYVNYMSAMSGGTVPTRCIDVQKYIRTEDFDSGLR